MRVEGDFIHIHRWLLPLSWLYGLGVAVRNLLFDVGVLRSRSFPLPVISVGNITVGGSGKTPHVEYLIRLLQSRLRVAVLSRGYKRKSRGYRLADSRSSLGEIGDEPLQMHRKFPDIYVAVDHKRTRGIERLTGDEATRDVGVVLLDDAFQHRYVHPGMNILLVDYHRLIVYDRLLPAGRLREPQRAKSRADVVIVTKCPKDLKPMEYRVLRKAMSLYPYQQLYFTTIDYDQPQGLFHRKTLAPRDLRRCHVLLLTGIASPQQIALDMRPLCKGITSLAFADHHAFTAADVEEINRRYEETASPRVILTTEKDATRLRATGGLSRHVRDSLYVLPIRVRFLLDGQDDFNQKITEYVRKDARDSGVAAPAHDHVS